MIDADLSKYDRRIRTGFRDDKENGGILLPRL